MRRKKKVRITLTVDEDVYKWCKSLPKSVSVSSLVNKMLKRRARYEEMKVKLGK